jgi:hypothetical protein
MNDQKMPQEINIHIITDRALKFLNLPIQGLIMMPVRHEFLIMAVLSFCNPDTSVSNSIS